MMRLSRSVLLSFILFVSSFPPFGRGLSQIVSWIVGVWCNNNGMCTRTQLCTVRLKRFQFAESCRGWKFPLKLDETWMCVCLSQLLLQSLVWSRPAAPRRVLFKCPWCPLDFCPCPRKSPLSQVGSSLLARRVHV